MFLRELQAMGRSAATLRSYGMDLLRWWRFLDAVGVSWDRASRVEARDFSCWRTDGQAADADLAASSSTIERGAGAAKPGDGQAGRE